MKIKTRLRK